MNNFTIRSAQEGDIEDIVKLLNQLGSEECGEINPKLRGTFDEMIRDGHYYVNVGLDQGGVIGTSLLMLKRNLTHHGRPMGLIVDVVVDS